MALPQSKPPIGPSELRVPIAWIVAMVGRGMTVREIRNVFPELGPEDIRSALLRAADILQDANACLSPGDPVGEMIRQAQLSSGLSDDEAMDVAVAETRAVRREQAARRK